MKKVIILLSAVFVLSLAGSAQNSKVNASGNYVSVAKVREPAKNSGKTFTDSKGIVYPVLESAKGKLFYTRVSKAGNEYNVYLKF